MGDLLELTARAEATHFWFHGFRAYIAPAIQDIAAGRLGLRIIDCGCGTGFNLKTLLLRHGRTFGFDLVPEGIQRARAVGRLTTVAGACGGSTSRRPAPSSARCS